MSRVTRSFMSWFFVVAAGGCVALPESSEDGLPLLGDGSIAEDGLVVDGGSERPPTGEPYRGPQCATPPGQNASADGGTLDELPGWSDASMAMDDTALPTPVDDAGMPMQLPSLPHPSAPGQIVITELMVDPSAVGDSEGEWVELWNASESEAFELGGCMLDDGAKTPRMLEPLVIEKGAIATLARSAGLGFTPSLVVSLSLTNSADTVAIACDGVEIDRVRFGAGFPLAAGSSLSLDPQAWASADNDSAATWCAGSEPYAGDRGTPGNVNPSCIADGDAGEPML
jgi:hypothetical protein